MKSNRILELDALRGIAALLVVFFHYTIHREESTLGFKLGTTGVDLFFIISGFVILMSLSRIKSAKHFVFNRLVRLYPAYWAAVTITFLVSNYIDFGVNSDIYLQKNFIDYFINLTMFQMYFEVGDIDGPYWTLVLEMLFYILMLILLLTRQLKNIQLYGFLLIIGTVALNLGIRNSNLIQVIFFYLPVLQFIPLFFAGTLFYQLYTKQGKQKRIYFLIGVTFLVQLFLFKTTGRSFLFISQLEYTAMISIYYLLFFLFIHGKLKFIVNRLTLFLGGISYSLYLIHQMISIKIVIPYLILNYGFSFWTASLCFALPLSIILAYLITSLVEKPIGKYLKKKFILLFIECDNSKRNTWLLSSSILLTIIALIVLKPIFLSSSRFNIPDPKTISVDLFMKEKNKSIFSLSMNDTLSYVNSWQNTLIEKNDSSANVLTTKNDLYGITFKTDNLPEFKSSKTHFYFHCKTNQLNTTDSLFYLVIELKQDQKQMMLLKVVEVSSSFIQNKWSDFYLECELPKITSDDYNFSLYILNSQRREMLTEEFEFFLTKLNK
ncbi:MAG TPA: acyltransferase [Crocinitomicaceae bacterium]|nr:acyltransferase [Crocinitomicaceae bacterium]